ncbi:MAG: hypothetical protein AAGH19_12850 [Pseudomonadota bacterium]
MATYWIRGIVYALLAAALAQISMLEALRFPPDQRFSEFGFIEFTQSAILAFTVAVLVIADWRSKVAEPLLRCMALAFAILLIRENDQVLELWLPHGIWKWPAGLVFVAMLAVFWRNRQAVFEQLDVLAKTPAMGVLFTGFATLVFSRLFGRTDFWMAVMEDRYWRPVKNAAEEGLELFALGLLAAGVVEWLLARRKQPEVQQGTQ